MYALKDRVNQLFFGILLINEQLKQNDILKNDLLTSFNRVSSLMVNGLATQSDTDVLKVELINVNQRITDLINTRKTYEIMLSALCGIEISDKNELEKPKTDISKLDVNTNYRPELGLFDAQSKLYLSLIHI